MKLDLEVFRRKLNALRDRITKQVKGLAEEAMPEPRGDGNWSTPTDDVADVSARKVDEALTLSLVANEENLLALIDAALVRMDKGTFGACEDCGKSISKERLEAVPYASECIHCARDHQQQPT